MELPGVVKVGYLTMLNRPIYEVLESVVVFFSHRCRCMSKKKIYGMSIMRLLLLVLACHILWTLQSEAVALFFDCCVFSLVGTGAAKTLQRTAVSS